MIRRIILVCGLSVFLSACATDSGLDKDKAERAADINARLGVGYMRQGKYEIAKEKLEKALRQDPDNGDIYHYMAELYRRVDEPELAEEYFQKAISYNENDSALMNNYAVFLCGQKKYKEADKYFCPNNKALSLQAKHIIQKGVIYRRYAADKSDCTGCEMKAKCITNKKGKRRTLMVTVGHVPGNLSKAMAEKVDSEKGRKIYHQRIGIVEPVFANIERNKGMDRFTLRGKIKVNIQWLLYSMVHNIGKIAVYGCT